MLINVLPDGTYPDYCIITYLDYIGIGRRPIIVYFDADLSHNRFFKSNMAVAALSIDPKCSGITSADVSSRDLVISGTDNLAGDFKTRIIC